MMPSVTFCVMFRPRWLFSCALWLTLGLLLSPSAQAQATPPVVNPAAPRLAVVLAGGVSRSFAYLGALEALVEAGVPVDVIIGSSGGALAAGFYSAGYSFATVRELLYALEASDIVRLRLPPDGGLLDLAGFQVIYEQLVGGMRLEETEPRLAVMATELRPTHASALERGDLTKAVRASIAIPLIFAPGEFEGKFYTDGSLREPVPVAIARQLGADLVLSIRSDARPPARPDNLLDALTLIVGAVVGPMRQDPPDVALRVRVTDQSYFDFARAPSLMRRGYETAQAELPRLLAELQARGVVLRPHTTGTADPHAQNPINGQWRERLARGLALARALPKPLTVLPTASFGLSAYDWGTEPDAPAASFGFGLDVSGGALGPFGLSLGLENPTNQPGLLGQAALRAEGGSGGLQWSLAASLAAANRPAGTPWAISASLAGPSWQGRAWLDAKAAGLAAHWQPQLGAIGLHGQLEGRWLWPTPSQAGGLRLETSLAGTWLLGREQRGYDLDEAGSPFVRARLLAGVGPAGARAFALGAPALLRAYAPDSWQGDGVLVGNLEFGYRLDSQIVAGLASLAPELRLFGDLGYGFNQNDNSNNALLWDIGAGVTLPGQLLGFLPFQIGLDAAAGPSGVRFSLFSRLPLP
jgi:NTE family protein